MIVKPMLSATVKDVNQLRFPLLASAKIDGIRAFTRGFKLLSRTGKPIPNNHIRTTLESLLPNGMDGELVVGKTFQETSSAVMSVHGKPEFTYYIFDMWSNDFFSLRQRSINEWFKDTEAFQSRIDLSSICVLPQHLIYNLDQLAQFEQDCLACGAEGVMLRDPNGLYKQGRSTMREQGLMKLKRFTDSEAVVIGVEELMINDNPQTTSELGYAKRSSHQENKRPGGMMGAIKVRDLKTGIEFSIGTGFNECMRMEWWKEKEYVIGKIVKYKSFSIGVKEKPRHPVFLGFRYKEDM